LSRKFIGADGTHIKNSKVQYFEGNLVFASKNAFNLQTLSRRDDVISLAYLLIYLLEGKLPFIGGSSTMGNQPLSYQDIRDHKIAMKPEDLCAGPKSRILLPFLREAYSL